MHYKVVGIRTSASIEDVIGHFRSLGGDVVLMEPLYIYGKDHAVSAVMHAQRAFENGSMRSKTVLTEILMYAAGERQISKATARMRPKGNDMVAVAIDCPDDLRLSEIGASICDDIMCGTDEKASAIGLDNKGTSARYEDLALELVAMLDIAK